MIRVPLALFALLLLAAPAAAQQFSTTYQFLEAVRKGDGAKVNDLLQEHGAALINSTRRDSGEGALHIVARRSDGTYLRFLLQQGADPNIRDLRGNSPLMIAVEANFNEGVLILIRYRVSVNLANAAGETPLIRALQRRNIEAARTLLAAGADPDQADRLAGMSARDYARVETRVPELARLLDEFPPRGASRP